MADGAARLGRWLLAALLMLAAVGSLAAPNAAPADCPPALPVDTADASPPHDRGLLWRIRRDGRVSYLFGTLHVGKPPWRHFGPRTLAALRASDVLAVELDPGDPAVLQALAAVPAPPPLPPELQQRLADARSRACVGAESMAYLHPLLQVSTLAVLEARWLGLDPAYALEHLLLAQARALHRRVVSLESPQLQTGVLVPADEGQARTLLEQSLQQLEDHSGRRVLQRLAAAWEQGDLATLEDYGQWCECVADADDRDFLRRLNDDRNPALADGIEAVHRRGRRVFAAVGALHMTGPRSLPRLLAQRGFKVERVAFVR